MEKAVLATLKYFKIFDYPTSFEEIYFYLQKKTSKIRLQQVLVSLIKKKYLIYNESQAKYTVGEYSIKQKSKSKSQISKMLIRQSISKNKIKKIQLYIKLLSFFPQIRLIGLSGSLAMLNAKKSDDIDLFIITDFQRLWTGRFACLLIAQLLGIRRSRLSNQAKDKVCLNLFFDNNNLVISKKKQTVYVAHEVLQMKPLVNKELIHERFLKANSWVYTVFPNYPKIKTKKYNAKRDKHSFLGDYVELIVKKLQFFIIKKHKTKEIITKYQLWFFPEDFENKISDII